MTTSQLLSLGTKKDAPTVSEQRRMKIEYKFGLSDEHRRALLRTLNSSTDFIEGEEVHRFEEDLGKYFKTDHVICLSSGTAALHLALMAVGFGAGDEVITPSNSFNSSADTIVFAGAKPKFVDIENETYNMDTSKMRRAYSGKTKCVMPVHFGGHPTQMDDVMDFAKSKKIPVVEDAAQSFGARFRKKLTGTIGDIGIISFVHHKHVTVFGDGGAVLTNDSGLARKVRLLANHGRGNSFYRKDRLGIPEQRNETIALNYRLGVLAASLGRVSLRQWISEKTGIEIRRKMAKYYELRLASIGKKLLLPKEKSWALHSYLRYLVLAERRDQLYNHLMKNGIDVKIHYRVPIHLLPPYVQRFGYRKGMFPVTEWYCSRTLSLPMCPPGYTSRELDYVAESVSEFYENSK